MMQRPVGSAERRNCERRRRPCVERCELCGAGGVIRAFLRHRVSASTHPAAELGALLGIVGLATLVLVDIGVVAAALLRFRRSRMLGG